MSASTEIYGAEKTAWVSGMFAHQHWNTCIFLFSFTLIADYKISFFILKVSYLFLDSLFHALSSFCPHIFFFCTVPCQQPLSFPDSSVCMFGEAGWERKWETCVRFELGGKIMGRAGRTFQESVCMGDSPPLPFASPSPPNPCLICLFFQVQDSLILVTGQPG